MQPALGGERVVIRDRERGKERAEGDKGMETEVKGGHHSEDYLKREMKAG